MDRLNYLDVKKYIKDDKILDNHKQMFYTIYSFIYQLIYF